MDDYRKNAADPVVRSVYETLARVLGQKEHAAPIDIEPQHKLAADLGLTSLELARVVALLELTQETDPFSENVAITSVRTVADLCAAYCGRPLPSAVAAQTPSDSSGTGRAAQRRKAGQNRKASR